MLDMEKFREWMNTEENFNRYNGLEFTVLKEGYCEVEVNLTQQGRNPQGVAHGSLLFSLCDAVTGMAAATMNGGRSMLTQNATIHYLRPGISGRLKAVGRMLHCGRTTGLARAEVFDENGKLLSIGEFTIFYTGEPVVLPESGVGGKM